MDQYRTKLDGWLKGICSNVYFQPPSSIQMKYPCIRYTLSSENIRHADNKKYTKHKRYSVTVIDRNPDSLLPDRVGDLPYCSLERTYFADGLNHFVYTIYI